MTHIEPFEDVCGLCGAPITNWTAPAHLFSHGITTCGVGRDGVSLSDVRLMESFHVIHVAGPVQDGVQRCSRCGIVLR